MNIELSEYPARSTIYLLIKQLRPKQWTKNLLVFAALLFSIQRFSTEMFLKSVTGFLLFCLISSCVYIINDYVDREQDRLHPDKKNRPMASGALNPKLAMSFGILLFSISMITAVYLNVLFAVVLLLYFLINITYSLRLKHVVIIDIMIIASGFVLRAIGGGIVIGVELTPWFLLCTLLLALFLAISKRRHELYLLEEDKKHHRKVLEHYSIDLLNQFNSIVTTATIVFYALFTFTSGHSIYLMWTMPLVIYGIFRYLYLIHKHNKGGKPEQVLFEDKHILVTVILYALLVFAILLLFG